MSKGAAASVRQRLLKHARQEGVAFSDVLQRYALERWLYRLSKSGHVEQFILKGALMLFAWGLPVTRPTRDIDLLARVRNDPDGIRDSFPNWSAAEFGNALGRETVVSRASALRNFSFATSAERTNERSIGPGLGRERGRAVAGARVCATRPSSCRRGRSR